MEKSDIDRFSMIALEQSKYNINRLKSARNWHTLEKFQDLIHHIDFADLYSLEGVAHAKHLLHEMSAGCYEDEKRFIFSHYSPFPDYQLYVYVYAPEYVQVLSNLNKSLKEMEGLHKTNEIKEFVELSKEAFNQYCNSITAIKGLIYSQVQVYDRAKFEEVFQVDWNKFI